jgi:RNA polymerase sigma-70 factor (ECF subfamily)
VALHRVVAVAEVQGPEVALPLLDQISLEDHHLFHAIRGDLLRRVGLDAQAADAYDAAIARTANQAERELLARRRGSLA